VSLDVSPLIRRMREQFEAEFPGWRISRDSSGRWCAVRTNWGALYGQSAPELRDRLRRWEHEGQGSDA
jgi:hypothetical protein